MALTRCRAAAIAFMLLAGFAAVQAQTLPAATATQSDSSGALAARHLPLESHLPALDSLAPQLASPLQPLLDFKDSDVKFNLLTLMNTLRDNRHEGWVLAAYPDPKTSRPLIGAGFSLDVAAGEHIQRDPLNPNQFLEPSSAQLWEAAGLDPPRLETMLQQFDRELSAWKKKQFRRKIRTHSLFPEITEEDATKLLRISTIQAVHNARAYCRDFDQLTGPQQMALTQLVFQMGVNLEEFTQFLSAINTPPNHADGLHSTSDAAGMEHSESAGIALVARESFDRPDAKVAAFGANTTGSAAVSPDSQTEYWKSVQDTLIHSDWARRYSTRAVSVIAMFDPNYASAPWEAEAKVSAEVHPLHRHRRHAATVRTASASHKKSSARRMHKS